MISITEEARNGKGFSCAGVELIPCSFEGIHGTMNAFEKTALNEYIFYNHCSVQTISQSPKIIETIHEKLQILKPSVQAEKPQTHWTQKLLHSKKLFIKI